MRRAEGGDVEGELLVVGAARGDGMPRNARAGAVR